MKYRRCGKSGILLMFEMDECPFCHRMKTNVLNQPQVQDYFREHFLIFPVDVEGDIEVVDFAGNSAAQKDFALKQFRVRAVDKAGNVGPWQHTRVEIPTPRPNLV